MGAKLDPIEESQPADLLLDLTMKCPPHDPRAIANLLLDSAKDRDLYLTHISLQKLLYFAHGLHLVRYNIPLVDEGFEAWTYGPVHPGVYQVFKKSGAEPILFRAEQTNVISGRKSAIVAPTDKQTLEIVNIIMRDYGTLSAGRLVELSHAPLAPWAMVVSEAKTSIVLGMRIPDKLIAERFKYHKIPVGPERWIGELDVDSPLTRD